MNFKEKNKVPGKSGEDKGSDEKETTGQKPAAFAPDRKQSKNGSSGKGSSPEGKEDEKPATEPSELLSQGINFFSGLAKTLSSPQETQKLVHSITEKDEKSGQMYLNIPVESQETVSQVFNMLGQFLQKGQ